MKKLENNYWERFFTKLKNTVDGIQDDILVDSDEVKAFGEIALLKRDLEKFLKEHWDEHSEEV